MTKAEYQIIPERLSDHEVRRWALETAPTAPTAPTKPLVAEQGRPERASGIATVALFEGYPECLCGTVQWSIPRRLFESSVVPVTGQRTGDHRAMAAL